MNNTINAKEYFKQIIDLYVNARNCDFKKSNIFRGRSKTISSSVEELTAYYIDSNKTNNCNYFIDQPIAMKKNTRYPDIVIQKNDGIINDLIDVKTDTGWFRNGMFEFCKEWDERIESVKNDYTTFKSGLDKIQQNGQFSNSLKFHVIVITAINSGNKLLRDYKKINELDNIELYIMSNGKHPNTYNVKKSALINDINIDYNEFCRLLRNLK